MADVVVVVSALLNESMGPLGLIDDEACSFSNARGGRGRVGGSIRFDAVDPIHKSDADGDEARSTTGEDAGEISSRDAECAGIVASNPIFVPSLELIRGKTSSSVEEPPLLLP